MSEEQQVLLPDKEESQNGRRHRLIVMEPVVFFFVIGLGVHSSVFGQYLYFIIGRRYNLTSQNETKFFQCQSPNNNETSDSDKEVVNKLQELTTSWLLYVNVSSSAISLLTTPIYSAMTDRIGRKLPMTLVMIGYALFLGTNFCAMIFDLPLYVFVLAGVMHGLTGGMGTIFAAVFSYIADVTEPKHRGIRIAILEAVLGFADIIVQFGVGFWLKYQSYEWPYGFATGMACACIVYIICFVPETRQRQPFSLSKIFDDQKRVIRVFSLSQNRNSVSMILTLPALFLFCVQMMTKSITQEYEMGFPFCWDSESIGIYSGSTMFLYDVGLVTAAVVLSKCFHLHYLTIAGIGIISAILCKTITGFAFNGYMLYLSAVLGIFGMLPIAMIRAFLSSEVNEDDQGALFATVSFIEVLSNLLSSVAINEIYQNTVSWWPGFTFVVLASLGVVCLFLISIAAIIHKKRQNWIKILTESGDIIGPENKEEHQDN